MKKENKKKVVVFYPHEIMGIRSEVLSRKAPRERLYGFAELEGLGEFDVIYTDERYTGVAGWIVNHLRGYGINIAPLSSIYKIYQSDVVVIKDGFSSFLSFFCCLFGKRHVYYDSMFTIPTKKWKRLLMRYAVRKCDRIIGYSKKQSEKYSKEFCVPLSKFEIIDFALDKDFYILPEDDSSRDDQDYVLSVGRDPGRDFDTLVSASKLSGVRLKVVTAPYLASGILENIDGDVLFNVSYEDLFELYRDARAIAVPLKSGIDYPSGIRAVLESLQLGKYTIVSRTEYVRTNLEETELLTFVEPEDHESLAEAIRKASRVSADVQDVNLADYDKNISKVIGVIRELSVS